jgi:small subunit ribosomal protein S6
MALQRLYETTFIIRPDLEEPQVEAIQELIKDQLSKSKAPQVRWETWGKRKLAYPIQKCSKGVYFYVLYLADNDVVATLERTMRHHEDILRWLSVSVIDEVDSEAFDFDSWANRTTPLHYDKDTDARPSYSSDKEKKSKDTDSEDSEEHAADKNDDDEVGESADVAG